MARANRLDRLAGRDRARDTQAHNRPPLEQPHDLEHAVQEGPRSKSRVSGQ